MGKAGIKNDDSPACINVLNFRDKLRDVLDGTQFLNQRYIVTRYGDPMVRVGPPISDAEIDRVTVTDVRIRTKEILETVCQRGKPYLVMRYGRAAATIHPF